MQITLSGFNIFRCDSEEAIKSYGYPITKVKLEKAVMNAIQNNPNIYLYTGEIVVKQYPFMDMSYKQIADAMTVAERTVDGYRESLFTKLGVHSRIGLILEALKRDLVKL